MSEWCPLNECSPLDTCPHLTWGSAPDYEPGSPRWLAEEAVLYQEHNRFRCHVCRLVAHADNGGADDMPDACSECWSKAHPEPACPRGLCDGSGIIASQHATLGSDAGIDDQCPCRDVPEPCASCDAVGNCPACCPPKDIQQCAGCGESIRIDVDEHKVPT